MSYLTPNTFSSYEMTPEEELEGSVLTLTQIQVIQNNIALLAEEKLFLTPDLDDINKYIQDESYKRGQIDALQYRIDMSVASVQALKQFEQPADED